MYLLIKLLTFTQLLFFFYIHCNYFLLLLLYIYFFFYYVFRNTMYDCKAPLSRFYYPDTRRIINAFIIIIIIPCPFNYQLINCENLFSVLTLCYYFTILPVINYISNELGVYLFVAVPTSHLFHHATEETRQSVISNTCPWVLYWAMIGYEPVSGIGVFLGNNKTQN